MATVDAFISKQTKNTKAFFRRIRKMGSGYIKNKITFYIAECLQTINPMAMDSFII